jgi:hypothetical protein
LAVPSLLFSLCWFLISSKFTRSFYYYYYYYFLMFIFI